jgi:hypothetical protein
VCSNSCKNSEARVLLSKVLDPRLASRRALAAMVVMATATVVVMVAMAVARKSLDLMAVL